MKFMRPLAAGLVQSFNRIAALGLFVVARPAQNSASHLGPRLCGRGVPAGAAAVKHASMASKNQAIIPVPPKGGVTVEIHTLPCFAFLGDG